MSLTFSRPFRTVVLGLASLGLALSNNSLKVSAQEAKNAAETPKVTSERTSETVKTVVQRESIPFPTHRQLTTKLRSGTSRTVRNGVMGEKEVVYRVTTREDGMELRREPISSRVIKLAKPEVIEEGNKPLLIAFSRGNLASRGGYSERNSTRVVTMRGTWYDPLHCGGSNSGRTATGIKAGYGVVAVDPNFIRMGTRLFIEGYGYAVAGDTGGAIKGNRIDLGVDSPKDVSRFNIKSWKQIRVHILN